MNYKVVFSILGKALLIEAVLLIVPMFVGIIYQENNYLSFLIPLFALPFFIGDKEKREKAVCVGVMAGVLIILT